MIVIGGGVNGASVAYHSARERKRVLLLEQFDLLHERGQSYGGSKAFSFAYDNKERIKLAMQAWSELSALELVSGEKLFTETGAIDIVEDQKGCEAISKTLSAVKNYGIDHEVWDYETLREKTPVWHLPEGSFALYSPADGILHARPILMALLGQAASRGAMIKDKEPTINIFSDGSEVEVITANGRYRSDNLVIACGAWTNKVLAHLNFSLPIRTNQEQTVYFRPNFNADAFGVGTFPMWYHHRKPVVYGFPMHEEPGIKLGFHHDGLDVNIEDFNGSVFRMVIERLRAYLASYLSDANGTFFGAKSCLYDNSPDREFMIDFVPGLPNVFFIAGLSGHGFNPALAIGRGIADLIFGGQTDIEIANYKISRFSNT